MRVAAPNAQRLLNAGAKRFLKLVPRLHVTAFGEKLDVFDESQRHGHTKVCLEQELFQTLE